ncbi:MAG: UbiA family prenyltransferase [Nocardioidaceae bacterium]
MVPVPVSGVRRHAIAPRTARGLALSCHPLPTLAVTAMATVLLVVVGNPPGTCAVGAAAVLTGQLSIGWSNDLVDSRRDLAAGRRDKPVAAGFVAARIAGTATALALTATVPLSLALGWRAGVTHLFGVACGWLYNVWLKSTPLSPLPFLAAFASLPAVATLALPSHPWPPVWAMVASGLIGGAAHFGNVLPDLDEDARTGISGLPHRIGTRGTAALAAATGVAATVAVIAGSGADSATSWAMLAIVVALTAGGMVAVRRRAGSEAAFYTTMLVAAINVAFIATTSGLA